MLLTIHLSRTRFAGQLNPGVRHHKGIPVSAIHENFELCPDLIPGQVCFRTKIYQGGIYSDLFHDHIPAYRISQDGALEVLRSLIASYSNWSGGYILQSTLNKRGNDPACYPGFVHHTSYPCPGVMRRYTSSGNTIAWFDKVISTSAFTSGA